MHAHIDFLHRNVISMSYCRSVYAVKPICNTESTVHVIGHVEKVA